MDLFRELDLPKKFKGYRSGQEKVVQGVLTRLYRNPTTPVIAELPTGSGKTLIAVLVSKLLDRKMVYVCTTKTLQNQFMRDFPTAKLLKGRSNYPCGRYPKLFPNLTAAECPKDSCSGDCPYSRAKKEALGADIAVLNSAYFMSEVNFVGAFSGTPFLVLDEVDTLEDQLMGFVQVTITKGQLDRIGITPPRYKTKFEAWLEWAHPALRQVKKIIVELEASLDPHTIDLALARELVRLARLRSKLSYFIAEVDRHWVWEHTPERWTFKPVLVGQYGKELVWNHAETVLGMSATVLDFKQLTRNVGLEDYQKMQSTSGFDPAQRPVQITPLVDLSAKKVGTEISKLKTLVPQVLEIHKGERGLIHTVSYKTSKYLQENIPSNRLIYHSTASRQAAIDKYRGEEGSVLVSPSIERGEDFPDDLCRFILILKLPFPYLGDPQVSRRLYGTRDGQHWYIHRTVSALIQMSGRGMRNEDDWCITYVTDPAFRRIFLRNRSLFPKWWRDALKFKSVLGGGEYAQIASKEAWTTTRLYR